jgi:glycosyltransferase involved in cell wall biosynthesis
MAEKVSLLVATRGRTTELKRLLQSLVVQTYRNFEVIIVDQNQDDRTVPIVQEFSGRLPLQHVRSATHGHAAANNVALRMCSGDLITFPDDDCWYPSDLLCRIVSMFRDHPEWDGITGRETANSLVLTSPRFDDHSGKISLDNIWRRHISFSMFFRAPSLSGLCFDERLGVGAGTIWGAGEETEFLLQFMKRGNFVQYDPTIVIYHPDFGQGPYTMAAIAKARRYGMGMGRLLRIHRFPADLTIRYFVRPLLGGAYTLLRCKPRKAVYHWSIFLGRVTGWLISTFFPQPQVQPGVPLAGCKVSQR